MCILSVSRNVKKVNTYKKIFVGASCSGRKEKKWTT